MSLDPPIIDFILYAAGMIVVILGMAMTYRAMLRDRSRGRRRCPKCWYDMAGTPGLTCPECGRTAKSERSFFRTRRRWGRGIIAAILLLHGASFILAPKVRRDGWPSIVPTSVLVLSLPSDRELDPQVLDNKGSFWAPVSKEIAKRAKEDRLSSWQWGVLLNRVRIIRTREQWPVDEALMVNLEIPAWLDVGWVRINARLPEAREVLQSHGALMRKEMALQKYAVLGEPTSIARHEVGHILQEAQSIKFDVVVYREKPVYQYGQYPNPSAKIWEGVLTLPVQGVRTTEVVVSADETPETSESLLWLFDVETRTSRAADGMWNMLVFVDMQPTKLANITDMAVIPAVEIVHPERGVSYPLPPNVSDLSRAVFVGSVPDAGTFRGPNETAGWFIRIRGVRGDTLQRLDAARYWAGELDIPLSTVMFPNLKAAGSISDQHPQGATPAAPIDPPSPSQP